MRATATNPRTKFFLHTLPPLPPLPSLRMPDYGLRASPCIFDPLEPKPTISEANLSVKPSSFRVDMFARFSTAQRSSVMFESMDLVRFSHPESDSFLSISCDEKKAHKPPYLRKNTEVSILRKVEMYGDE